MKIKHLHFTRQPCRFYKVCQQLKKASFAAKIGNMALDKPTFSFHTAFPGFCKSGEQNNAAGSSLAPTSDAAASVAVCPRFRARHARVH